MALSFSPLSGNTYFMAKSIKVRPKRGRPATGKDPMVSARFPRGLIDQIEAWADHQKLKRSEAIRRLVELGLRVDPDNPPLTEGELERMKPAREISALRHLVKKPKGKAKGNPHG